MQELRVVLGEIAVRPDELVPERERQFEVVDVTQPSIDVRDGTFRPLVRLRVLEEPSIDAHDGLDAHASLDSRLDLLGVVFEHIVGADDTIVVLVEVDERHPSLETHESEHDVPCHGVERLVDQTRPGRVSLT